MTYEIVAPGEPVTLFEADVTTAAEVAGQELKGTNELEAGDDGWIGPFAANPAGTAAEEIGIDLVAPRGRVVGLGLCVAPDHMDSFRAISKEVEIIMSVFFTMGEFEAAIEALASETYRPQALISDKVSLPDMPAAFEALRRRTTQCKVLVEPSR